MIIIKKNLGTIKSNDGFFIGDPCFVLSDENCGYFEWGQPRDFRGGVIETPDGKFLTHYTLVGDGEYDSPLGTLTVESGALAIIPKNMIDYSSITEDKAKKFGAIIPGTKAQAFWIEAEHDDNNVNSDSLGNIEINITNPDISFKIVTGCIDVDELGNPVKIKKLERQ